MRKLARSFNVFGRVICHWLLFVICLNSLTLFAQNYPTHHFTMRDGLPSMSIRCIYKDSRSLMWIGTDAGLCSFDGKSFRIFKPSEGMNASQIWAIAEDEHGNMWFGSYGNGLYKYDGRHFERFTCKNGLADNHIRVLCWSKNFHCLVVGCDGGVSTIRGKTITSSSTELFNKKIGTCVTGLVDVGKFIYVTTYGQQNPVRYYPDTEKFISVHDETGNYPGYSFSTFLDSKGDTIFSLENKGISILSQAGKLQNDTLGQVFGMTEDKRGDLWLAAWSVSGMDFKGGIFRYNGKTYQNYKAAFGITDGEIWTVFYDHQQDILWIGTLNEGLFKAPFTAISTYPSSYFNLDKQKINDVLLDSKGDLWIASSRELIRMENDGSFSLMDKNQMILSYRKFLNAKPQLPFAPGYCVKSSSVNMDASLFPDFEKHTDFNFSRIIEDVNQSMIFSNEFGLFQYDKGVQKTDFLELEGQASEISVSGDTLIYSGDFTLLNPKFREKGLEFRDYRHFPRSSFMNFTDQMEPKAVTRLVKQNNRHWYTTSVNGLWMSEGMKLTHFNETDSTLSNSLNDICFDEKNHVIFGSNTGEIYVATFSDNKLKIDYLIDNEKGLQGSCITWLVAEQKGKLWAGTNRGLNCIDLTKLYKNGTYLIRFLDEEDGYTGQTSKRAVMAKDGSLWIGSDEQLIRLDTKSFLSNRAKSGKIFLKSLEINNTPHDSILKKDFDFWTSVPPGKITMKHTENNLVFSFDIMNYNNPLKDRFRYMLRGYDKTWNTWSEDRKAEYTNLPPGKYVFKVESGNLNTTEQAESLNIEFRIRRPWWDLWYLQIVAIGMFLALAVLITRKYTEVEKAKQLQKSEIEKKIVQMEMQALQAQMNPHFIFNCMNNIQYFVLANQMKKALVYLSDFSKVLRASLVNATLRMVPIDQETDFLNSYLRLEQMRFPDRFEYVIRSVDKEKDGYLLMPPMLVQPFVENAIRHGFMLLESKGQLSIVFEKTRKDLLKCTITDNGIGREKANKIEQLPLKNDRQHSGMITESRIRLFNSPDTPEKYKIIYTDLSENGRPCGLQVELYLPMESGQG